MKKLYICTNEYGCLYYGNLDETDMWHYDAHEITREEAPEMYELAEEWAAMHPGESWIVAESRIFGYTIEVLLSAVGYSWPTPEYYLW